MRVYSAVLCVALVGCGSPPDHIAMSNDGDEPDASAPVPRADASGAPIDSAPPPFDSDPKVVGKTVFVTSTVHNAGLGGDAGADGICADRALAAGLNGEFRAWLSTTSSAEARLNHATIPYLLTNGVRIADDWDDLTDGALAAAINRDETGSPAAGDVWTGTEPDGSSSSDGTCVGFTDGTGGTVGRCGASSQTNAAWTSSFTPLCSTQLRLYCLEQ